MRLEKRGEPSAVALVIAPIAAIAVTLVVTALLVLWAGAPVGQTYRLLFQGDPLPEWHPLVTGDPETTHSSDNSVRGWTTPEFAVPEEDWDQYVIDEKP